MDIKKIHKAPYNPRAMNKATRRALKHSIDEFGNISGIVINSRTGNILSGNHRWEEVSKKFGGQSQLALKKLFEDYHILETKAGEFTGYLVRIVDWDLTKEKSANVTANSDLVAGEFTSKLQDVLSDISLEIKGDLFGELRLAELKIDIEAFDDDLDLDDHYDIPKRAEKRNRDLEGSKDEESSEVREVRSVIKVSAPSDLKDDVKSDILEYLSKKNYYNEITIV